MSENKETVEQQDLFSFLDPTQDVNNIVRAPRVNTPSIPVTQGAVAKLGGVLRHLNYASLRPGQDRAVFSLFAQRDTICILPTGAGKSAIYIIPALCLNWRVVIFSPLVSLMKDQVEALQRFRLPSGQISSGQTPQENQMTMLNWESGDMQFLLVAPERLESEQFVKSMLRYKPDMVVVDEAHCLSQWGDSFRPSYRKIGDFIEQIVPKSVLCLTATATSDVEADIRKVLGISTANRVLYYPPRTNLKIHTHDFYSDNALLRQIGSIPGSTIVYCNTRKETERLYNQFTSVIEGGCLVYNGGMTSDERTTNQNAFMGNDVRVMFATNAFGLGVNKADIRGIVHRDISGSVESVAQEQGRAGRDGLDSQCVLFVDQHSFETNLWMINTTYPEEMAIRSVFYKMKQIADKDGVFQMTIDDLATRAGIHSKVVGSAIGIMKAARIIERTDGDENPSKVRVLKDHPDAVWQQFIDLVRTVGVRGASGNYEFKMSTLIQHGGIKHRKADDTLKKLDANGYITYTRPFRGKTTKIVSDVGHVDFARIAKRRLLAQNKLRKVLEFVQTPDSQKHDYLQRYFGATA